MPLPLTTFARGNQYLKELCPNLLLKRSGIFSTPATYQVRWFTRKTTVLVGMALADHASQRTQCVVYLGIVRVV